MFDPGGLGLVTDLSAAWIAALLDATLKGTVLLVLAFLADRLLDRAPAAARHLVWATALVGLLALPVLAPLTPGLEVSFVPRIELASPAPEAPAALDAPADPADPAAHGGAAPTDGPGLAAGAVTVPGTTAPGVPVAGGGGPAGPEPGADPEGPVAWATGWVARADPGLLLGGAWLLGALCVLVTLLVGKARIRWLARDADRVRDGPWAALRDTVADHLDLDRPVVLLRGRRRLVPMTWGVLRPRVMLPETADTWPEACRRNVLLHELAHVKRRDCLVQLLARLTCAVYWYHPLVWHAARRLRLEQEEACDDHVLRSGTLASDYARQLVGLARLLRAVRTPAHAGSTGVGRSDFMKRMRALLDGGRSRRPLGRRAAATLGSAAVVLVLGLAAVRPAPAADEAQVAGPTDAGEAGPTDGRVVSVDEGRPMADRPGSPLAAVRVPGLELAALEVRPPAGAGARASGSGGAPGPPAETGTDHRPRQGSEADEETPTAVATTAARDPSARAADGGASPGADPAAAREERAAPPPAADDRTASPGDGTMVEAGRNEESVAPFRSAFASYWHAADGDASVEADDGASGTATSGGFASVTASARELARRLGGLSDTGAREALLRGNVREGSTRSLAVVMEVSILAERPGDRVTAVRVIADAPSAARARFLYQVARANPWENVRTVAARQLRRLAPERVVPWLVTLVYEDTSPAVQRRAVTELARLDRQGVDASLMQIARSHPQAEVRLEAIIWLLRTGSGQALTRYVENA